MEISMDSFGKNFWISLKITGYMEISIDLVSKNIFELVFNVRGYMEIFIDPLGKNIFE